MLWLRLSHSCWSSYDARNEGLVRLTLCSLSPHVHTPVVEMVQRVVGFQTLCSFCDEDWWVVPGARSHEVQGRQTENSILMKIQFVWEKAHMRSHKIEQMRYEEWEMRNAWNEMKTDRIQKRRRGLHTNPWSWRSLVETAHWSWCCEHRKLRRWRGLITPTGGVPRSSWRMSPVWRHIQSIWSLWSGAKVLQFDMG